MSGHKLILASKSRARRMVLENAGVAFDTRDAAVDENKIKCESLDEGILPRELALRLASAKACNIDGGSENLVIGCDQVLALGERLYDKPSNMLEARAHLQSFSGRTHQLISAICLVQDRHIVWSHVAVADMYVRELSDAFIDAYLHEQGEQVLTSVGAYLLESRGAQLFERIDGDYFTVLGLPLLPLLEELRKRGILPA